MAISEGNKAKMIKARKKRESKSLLENKNNSKLAKPVGVKSNELKVNYLIIKKKKPNHVSQSNLARVRKKRLKKVIALLSNVSVKGGVNENFLTVNTWQQKLINERKQLTKIIEENVRVKTHEKSQKSLRKTTRKRAIKSRNKEIERNGGVIGQKKERIKEINRIMNSDRFKLGIRTNFPEAIELQNRLLKEKHELRVEVDKAYNPTKYAAVSKQIAEGNKMWRYKWI